MWLGLSRAAILTLSHARLERWFGERQSVTGDSLDPADLDAAQKVARAIHRVADHTPWTSNCLPQAMTARRMLRARGVPSTIYIGAKFHETEAKLLAHAWCRSGRLYLTGGNGADEFGAVIAYGTNVA